MDSLRSLGRIPPFVHVHLTVLIQPDDNIFVISQLNNKPLLQSSQMIISQVQDSSVIQQIPLTLTALLPFWQKLLSNAIIQQDSNVNVVTQLDNNIDSFHLVSTSYVIIWSKYYVDVMIRWMLTLGAKIWLDNNMEVIYWLDDNIKGTVYLGVNTDVNI